MFNNKILFAIPVIAILTVGTQVKAAPIASFSANPNPAAPGQFITFDASSSVDAQNYIWDFADGSSVLDTTSPVTSHQFSQFGTYNVSLTVQDGFGGADGFSRVISVSLGNLPPSAVYGDFFTLTGVSFTLDGTSSTDPNLAQGDSLVEYAWDLDADGGFNDVVDNDGTEIVPWATISSFFTVGVNQVGLKVTDSFGATSQTYGTVTLLAISQCEDGNPNTVDSFDTGSGCVYTEGTVPVPASVALLVTGLVGFGFLRRKSI